MPQQQDNDQIFVFALKYQRSFSLLLSFKIQIYKKEFHFFQ